MGLDSFMDGNSQAGTNSKSSSGGSGSSSKNSSSRRSSGPYKVIGFGWKKKIIDTEEEWDEIVEYIEGELGYNINTVMHWSNDQRHDFLHRAILGKNGSLETCNVEMERVCMVCEHQFIFPTDWEFLEYEEEAVCPNHTYDEVIDAYEEMNALQQSFSEAERADN